MKMLSCPSFLCGKKALAKQEGVNGFKTNLCDAWCALWEKKTSGW